MKSIDAFLTRLSGAQAKRPWAFVFASWLVVAVSVPFLMRLTLNSEFRALLPTDKASVQDYERVGRRVGGLSTLAVVIESDRQESMIQFGRDLVPKLEAIGAPYVRAVDSSTTILSDFVQQHRGLYAELADLEELRDALSDRLNFERARANPFFVQLDDEEPPDPQAVIQRMRDRASGSETRSNRHPSGMYVHPNGRMLVLFIRSDVRSGNSEQIRRLTSAVDAAVASLTPSRYAPDLRVSYGGSIIDDREEHDAIEKELTFATTLSVVLVLLLLGIYFRSLRSLPIIGYTLLVPVFATFAYAQISIGYLNTSTAFLGSIVVGNGVNPQIIWLARYFEERRRGATIADAIRETHLNVWQATFAASMAAALAYGSLIVTDFRGFHDFGIIGLVGMVLCWLAMVLLLPVAAVVFDRRKALVQPTGEAGAPIIGPAVAKVVFAAPRTLVVAASVLSLGALAATVNFVRHDPIEYDFRNLRSTSQTASTSASLGQEIKRITGGGGGRADSSIFVVLDRREDVAPLRAELERRRDQDHAPWGPVRTLDDLVPRDQEAKIEVLGEIRGLMLQYRRYADEELTRTIDENLPEEDIEPLTLADLPNESVRMYSERDGTRGRLIAIEAQRGRSIWDGRYLVEWANALREVRLPNGERPPLAGRAPIFADMIESIFVDGPKAVLASGLMTLLLVVLSFRTLRDRALTLVALVVGVVWMTGVLALMGTKLNFLNFVAFPIACGLGVDYGVNVMKRYVLEQHKGVEAAVRACMAESGGAVVLCSATTVVGYATLLISRNQALRSFGLAMSIAEITCLVTAVVLMPAILLVLGRRKAAS